MNVLLGPGTPTPKIVLPMTTSSTDEFAAAELQEYLRRMTGHELEIVRGRGHAGPLVRLLPRPAVKDMLGEKVDKALERLSAAEGFWIRMGENTLDVVGETSRGVVAGVYQVLDLLGARWFSPGTPGEVIPAVGQVELQPSLKQVVPLLETRGLVDVATRDGIDWMGKNRMNLLVVSCERFQESSKVVLEETEPRGITVEVMGARLGDWVPEGDAIWADENCLAMVDGERTGLKSGERLLCPTNRKVLDAVAARICRLLSAHPRVDGVVLGMNKDISACECDGCKRYREFDARRAPRLDLREGVFREHGPVLSDAVWDLFNTVRTQVLEEHPERVVRFLAEEESLHSPKVSRLRAGASALVRPAPRCYRHVLNSDECLPNQCVWRPVEAWLQRAKVPVILFDEYEYPDDLIGLPFPFARVLSTEIVMMAEFGAKGIVSRARWNGSPINILNLWLFARQSWHGDVSADPSLKDFFEHYYGSVAKEMRSYFQEWYYDWLDIRGCFLGSGIDLMRLMTSQGLVRAHKCLEGAARAPALSEPERERLKREAGFFFLAKLCWNYLQSIMRLFSLEASGSGEEAAIHAQEKTVSKHRSDLLACAAKLKEAGLAMEVESVHEVIDNWREQVGRAILNT